MPDFPEDFADAVRRSYEHPVDDATAKRHVTAMVRVAQEAADPPFAPTPVPARRRRRALRPAFAAGLAALVLPAGLAVAGVQLPDAVNAPYDVVGVELPNQASDTAEERVPDAIPARTTPSTTSTPGTSAPGVPDGGVREGHGADDARDNGERRSEERNKARRGDERRRENRPKTEQSKPAPKPKPGNNRGGSVRESEPKRRDAPPKRDDAPKPPREAPRVKDPTSSPVPEPARPPKAEKPATPRVTPDAAPGAESPGETTERGPKQPR